VHVLDHRLVHRHERRDPLHGDEGVAERPGHVRVDLGDDHARLAYRRVDDVDGNAERDEPVLVGQRDLDQRDVDLRAAGLDQLGHAGERHGDVVGLALLDQVAGVGADEEDGVAVAALGDAVLDGDGAVGEEVDELHVVRRALQVLQRANERPRGGASGPDEDVVAGADGFERLLGRNETFLERGAGPCGSHGVLLDGEQLAASNQQLAIGDWRDVGEADEAPQGPRSPPRRRRRR
jgi:hypothetical protein